jgi:hypothetical protein
MASKPLKRVRGHLIFGRFFWLWWSGVFAGVFREIGCANVVLLRGKRGGVVVICVAKCGGKFWAGNGTGFWGLFCDYGEQLAALPINARQEQRQQQIQGSFTAFRMTTFSGGRLWREAAEWGRLWSGVKSRRHWFSGWLAWRRGRGFRSRGRRRGLLLWRFLWLFAPRDEGSRG